MRKFVFLLVIVGVVAGAILLGWFGTGTRSVLNTPPGSAASTPPDAPTPLAPAGATPRLSDTRQQSAVGTNQPTLTLNASSGPGTSPAATPGPNDLITNWEERIDQILVTEGPETAKAKQMLEMFPRVNAEGQLELAQHLSNLLPDEEYAALGKYLTDAKLPEDVLDELMADVLNRPNSVKLPYLLEVARQPQHPKASEARDLLELFLEEDYGNDWAKWQAKTAEWLKDNPD